MYKLENKCYGDLGFPKYLIGYANLENVNVIEIEDIKDEK